MKIMLLAACLLALIVPVRAEDKPAGGGGNPKIKAEHQEKRKAHREKMKSMREKSRQERKAKKAAATETAPAPAAK